MSKMLKVRNVNDYSRYLGCKEQHPLVSVIDYAEGPPRLRIPSAFQPDVQEAGGGYAVGIQPKGTGLIRYA